VSSKFLPFAPFAVLMLVLGACGVSREASAYDGVDNAAVISFADGTEAVVPLEDLTAVTSQLGENPDAAQLLFAQPLPATFDQDVLSSLIQVKVLDVALAESGGSLAEGALAAELEVIDGQLDDAMIGEPDPEAAVATIKAGASEYLDLVAEQRIRQNAMTDLFLTGETTSVPCARHILVTTEEEAQSAIARLEAGEDFAELAIQLSTGPTGPNGGDLGCSDPGGYVEPFRDAIIDAALNQVIGPVQTEFGFHVIEVYDTESIPEDRGAAGSQGFAVYSEVLASARIDIPSVLGSWDVEDGRVAPT
jgi:parvulin-like peptidyl-prolyl isomerase